MTFVPSSTAPETINEPAEQINSTRVRRYSYYALGVLTLVNFLNYIDRQILPSVAPIMAKDLHLSDTEIGAMEGALLLSFTVLAPVFGRLGDRRSRTRLMASAAVIWSVATGFTAFADRLAFVPPLISVHIPVVNFGLSLSGVALLLCFVRAIVGVGESSYSTITPSLIADYFPPHKRGTALGVFQAAIPMGFALGYVIGAVLAHFFGWRMAFLIVGLPGLVTAVFVWRLREPERGAQDHLELTRATDGNTGGDNSRATKDLPKNESWIRTALTIVGTRDWFLSTAGYTALTFVLGAFSTWANLLFVREKGMTETGAGIALGVVTLFAGATGTFGGGWIADRLAAKRENAYFLVCALSCLLGMFPLVVALATRNPFVFLPAVFFTVMLLFINNAPFHAILIGSVPSAIRASSVALNIVVIHICGDIISRFGVGVLSDSIEAGQAAIVAGMARVFGIEPLSQHLTAALMVAPVALLISSAFFFVGASKRGLPNAKKGIAAN
jgi:MFS family permease